MASVNQIEDRLREERRARLGELLTSLLPLAQYAQLDQKIWNGYVLREVGRLPDPLVASALGFHGQVSEWRLTDDPLGLA